MNSSSPANVADYLLAGKSADDICLLPLGREHSYGELLAASNRIAAFLLGRSFAKGDRVLLVGDNSFFWVAAYLGAMRAGMVCVPLPPGVARSDLEHILRVTEPRLVFVQDGPAVRRREEFGSIEVVTEQDARCDTPEAPFPEVQPGDLASLMFTSGSTGRPRGVMVSHANIVANTESIIQYLRLTGKDRMMAVLPFYYCFGTSLLHTHLRVGGSLVIDSRFMYPEVVLQRMADTRCTGFAGVPSHFQILLRKSSLGTKRLPALRQVQQAGGHLAVSFVRALRQALPDVQVFVMYGQTEATARLSYLAPDLFESRPGSIGKAIPGVTLRVLDEQGQEVRPGEVGEIVAEGGNVARGYWRDPEETARAFRNGRLYTGDLARVDEEGFIYVVDRARDILKCGGRRVSCQQVEDQLLEFSELVEAAVVAVADDHLGEAVKAFVVPRAPDRDHLEERLRVFCRRQMPAPLVPKEIVVVSALPKNAAGKVLRARLKSWAGPD